MQRSYIREILDCINEDTISFAGGLPSSNNFPLKEIQEASKEVLKNEEVLQYMSSSGLLGLREQIALWYTNILGFKTKASEILITTGSQQAFDMIGKTCIKEEVIVQEPSYIGALNAYKLLGLKLKGFKNISSLKNVLKENNALYLMSTLQNPNTTSYDQKQKDECLLHLKESKSLLIEDDAYMFLRFDGKINIPISSFYEKSFHLGSFSKIIAPGLRVGWIRANESLLDKVIIVKEALDLHTSSLSQYIISSYLENNDIFAHLEKTKKDYKNKMEFMALCLNKYIPSFHFTKPDGGMFIYGSFEQDSYLIAKKALEKNIAIVPASVFYYDNRKSKEARFNFSNASMEEIEKGIKIIASLL